MLKVDDNYQTKQIIRNMFPSPIWILKYFRVAWKLSFTLISPRITSTKWFSYNCPLKIFLNFFSSEQKNVEENTDFIPPEVSLNYLEDINERKPMYQHTLDT